QPVHPVLFRGQSDRARPLGQRLARPGVPAERRPRDDAVLADRGRLGPPERERPRPDRLASHHEVVMTPRLEQLRFGAMGTACSVTVTMDARSAWPAERALAAAR